LPPGRRAGCSTLGWTWLRSEGLRDAANRLQSELDFARDEAPFLGLASVRGASELFPRASKELLLAAGVCADVEWEEVVRIHDNTSPRQSANVTV